MTSSSGSWSMLLATSVICVMFTIIISSVCHSHLLPSASIVVVLTAPTNRLGETPCICLCWRSGAKLSLFSVFSVPIYMSVSPQFCSDRFLSLHCMAWRHLLARHLLAGAVDFVTLTSLGYWRPVK